MFLLFGSCTSGKALPAPSQMCPWSISSSCLVLLSLQLPELLSEGEFTTPTIPCLFRGSLGVSGMDGEGGRACPVGIAGRLSLQSQGAQLQGLEESHFPGRKEM